RRKSWSFVQPFVRNLVVFWRIFFHQNFVLVRAVLLLDPVGNVQTVQFNISRQEERGDVIPQEKLAAYVQPEDDPQHRGQLHQGDGGGERGHPATLRISPPRS